MATRRTKKNIEDFSLSEIEDDLASLGVTMFDESEPEENVNVNAIPFRNLALQKITGGVYQGKFFEIASDSQGGKSFHLYALLGDTINLFNGYSLLLDGERALEESYAKMMNLNIRSPHFMLAEKRTKTDKKRGIRGEPIIDVEQFFKLAYAFATKIRERDKDLSHMITIGVDSYLMFKTADDLDKVEKGKEPMGYAAMQRAAKFYTCLSTYLPKFDKLGANFILLNQLTKNNGVTFGDPWESNAENKIKFYATQRLKGRLVGKIKDKKTGAVIGVKVKWTTIKNRGVMPFQNVVVTIYYNKGIDIYSGLVELLIADGTIREAKQKNEEIGKAEKGFKIIKDSTQKFYSDIKLLVKEHPEVLEPKWTKDIDMDEIEEEVEDIMIDEDSDD